MGWRRWAAVVAVAAAAVAGLLALAPRYWSQARGEPTLVLPSRVLVGPRASVAQLRGRPAIVHYWASWCEPCRREAPELARLARVLGDRGRLVGVDVADERAGALAFVRRNGWDFPNLEDGRGTSSRDTEIVGLPMTLLVDGGGKVVKTLYGPQTARRLLGELGRGARRISPAPCSEHHQPEWGTAAKRTIEPMQHAASAGTFSCMRTTVDLPDELLTQARRRAADEGTTLTALLADGLRLRLARCVPPASARRALPASRNRGGMRTWIDPGSNASLLDAADNDSAPA
jgi:thiol-disulfide isomerase/thioredoxin